MQGRGKVRRQCLAVPALAVLLSVWSAACAGAWVTMDDRPEGAFALGGELKVTDPGAMNLRLTFGADKPEEPSSSYLLSVTGQHVAFSRVEDGEATPIGDAGQVPVPEKGSTIPFTLHRDDWRMAFVWDGRVVAKAYDARLKGPVVAHEAGTGLEVSDIWLQAVEEIDAADTFERTEEEDKEQAKWDAPSGEWSLISLREDRLKAQMQADKASNAFSYYCIADQAGLSTLGSWYWRNCSYSTAVRGRGGAVGLGFYVQDVDNYLLLRWDSRYSSVEGGPALSLIARVNGQERVLAQQPGGYLPG